MTPAETLIQIALSYQFVRLPQGQRWVDFFSQPFKDVAWCALFQMHCLKENQERNGFAYDLIPDPGVMHLYQKNVSAWETVPQPGFIMTWHHANTGEGHAGLITEIVDSGHVKTIEGNTSDSDHSVERMGHGVYQKTRPLGPLGEMIPNVCFLNPFYKRGGRA